MSQNDDVATILTSSDAWWLYTEQ